MDCDTSWHGSFSVPAAYASVSEPGGIIVVRKADGSDWHPAPSDVARLGVRIETSPTDSFSATPLGRLTPTSVAGGQVYSRVVCQELACVFEGTFVPAVHAHQAAHCGAFLARIDLDGQSASGLAAAARAIRFQWSFGKDHGSIALSELDPHRATTSPAEGLAPARDQAGWLPTAVMVGDLENKLRLPSGAEPISSYGRYYTGEMISGRKMIKGYYISSRDAGPPGVFLRASDVTVADGGCSVVTVYYDVQTEAISNVSCNGLG